MKYSTFPGKIEEGGLGKRLWKRPLNGGVNEIFNFNGKTPLASFAKNPDNKPFLESMIGQVKLGEFSSTQLTVIGLNCVPRGHKLGIATPLTQM